MTPSPPTPRVIRPTALKRLKETYLTGELLLPHVIRHVMRTTAVDVRPEDHSLQHMHPSDMAKPFWCGRHDYYRITGHPADKTAARNPSFRMENALAEGHTIHAKYQTWFWEMGVLWGMWRCRECGHYWADLSPKQCAFCHSERLVYAEYPMRRRNLLVEGHADAAVHFPDFRALV